MNKRLIRIFMVVIALMLFATLPVSAGTKTTGGSVAGVPVWAEKGLNYGSGTFSAYVWSHAASSIGKIGYRWWTVREYCPAYRTYPVNLQYGGEVNYGSDSKYSSVNTYSYSCPNNSTKQFQNLGTHDFKQGTSEYTPQVDLYENR